MLALCILVTFSTAAQADPIEGYWLTPRGKNGGQGIVHLYRCENRVCGQVVEVMDPRRADEVGTEILRDMRIRKKKPGRYGRGKIYSPDRGKWFRAKARLRNQDKLRIGGCWKNICKMQNWSRVDPPQAATTN